MYIKIHAEDKIIYLCDSLTPVLDDLIKNHRYQFIDAAQGFDALAIYNGLQTAPVNGAVIIAGSLAVLKKQFFKKFKKIHAGGGLVLNEKNEVLLIFRRGFWDLPKGKLDAGETIEMCAVREVQEETGLQNVTLQAPLTVTHHTYTLKKNNVIKISHWYRMYAPSTDKLIPQTAEDITEIKWVKQEDLAGYKALAYGSIVDVLDLLN